MVWEQGCVVLVALCRLQESGESSCARYWPEEGAEVYHIYEVHLVSEHIWTDGKKKMLQQSLLNFNYTFSLRPSRLPS